VKEYNTDIELFPGSLIASLSGLQREEPFKTDPGSRIVPKVQF